MMAYIPTTRYCADPDALAALRRDGMGWGHDVDCGCFQTETLTRRPGPLARLTRKFIKRT